ncbi:hypothetical protein VNI00_003023 [Paramarasmius palmivorus]|uniref:Alpha/beta hydrolase fold-3 domain-containing protein n=1 Tax=Paramarasmius palmivorus TaxID=297713 RepID=A0AAW0DWM3_9AGAR
MTTPTYWERLAILPRLLPLPFILAYTALSSLFATRKKSLSRILNERSVRYITSHLSVSQLQWMSPPASSTYRRWVKAHRMEELTEMTNEGVKLMWMGKPTKNIIFVAHGGAYMFPLSDPIINFWFSIRRELELQGHDIGIVFVEYSLYPNPFPTQLTQLIHGLTHIFKSYPSSNIHVAGDSAGANLVLQLLGHTIHPIPDADVPPSPLTFNHVRGVMLMSPWTSPGLSVSSSPTSVNLDVLSRETIEEWGNLYIQYASPSHLPYIRFSNGVKGIGTYVDRAFIFVGGVDHLRDDGLGVYEVLKEELGEKAVLEYQEDGVHNDPMFHVASGAKELNEVGKRMVYWLAAGL